MSTTKDCRTCMMQAVCKYREEFGKFANKVNEVRKEKSAYPFDVKVVCKEWIFNMSRSMNPYTSPGIFEENDVSDNIEVVAADNTVEKEEDVKQEKTPNVKSKKPKK